MYKLHSLLKIFAINPINKQTNKQANANVTLPAPANPADSEVWSPFIILKNELKSPLWP